MDALRLQQYNREYRKKNVEKLNAHHLSYYHEHKKIIECQCGSKYIKQSTDKHGASKKHQKYLASITSA